MTFKFGAAMFAASLVLAGGVLAAPASATVLTFDDLSGSGTLQDGYGGVTWGGQWGYYDFPQDPYNPASGAERIYPDDNATGSFSFSTPVVFDGADFAGYSDYPVTFTGYDASGNLLFTSGSLAPTATPTFLASGYSGLVSSITVNSGYDHWIMDNVTFNSNVAATPEPSQAAILGIGALGLTGLMFAARKRSAKSAA